VAKNAVDEAGRVVLRQRIKRAQLLAFFAALSPCLVAMEACSGAHFRARDLGRLGHDARLMPPSYVKPCVKRGETDAADGEATCEAVTRPNLCVTPQACLRHDAGQDRRAAIGADDAQSDVVAARGIFWCAS